VSNTSRLRRLSGAYAFRAWPRAASAVGRHEPPRPHLRREAWPLPACLHSAGRWAFEFSHFDDNAYVYENPWVRNGVTLHGVIWAFNVINYFYWQPLTWLSHMWIARFFGLRPAGPHLVNILFHSANSVLAFLIFRRLTGDFWRSAVLAALFALHPLRVESVVWIAERKDVLSAFWFLVTLGAYLRFVEPAFRPAVRVRAHGVRLGLMSKPMLITTPVLLLLLDYWPLRRPRPGRKISAVSDGRFTLAITYLGARELRAINWAANLPLWHRIANALVSYVGLSAAVDLAEPPGDPLSVPHDE